MIKEFFGVSIKYLESVIATIDKESYDTDIRARATEELTNLITDKTAFENVLSKIEGWEKAKKVSVLPLIKDSLDEDGVYLMYSSLIIQFHLERELLEKYLKKIPTPITILQVSNGIYSALWQNF